MENSTGKTAQKDKTKIFLIDKELKTKDLRHTAAERASGSTTKPNPKPESKPRIASAKGRVKPPARLLRCATALRVTAPLGCGSRRLGREESDPPSGRGRSHLLQNIR